ncbi:biotin-dependent carboxyltransferase family protein [Aquimarina sp. U1-2]|uniref:5-oxoprolinase subunit C family protein n=1 Tax=Aquimarina sp. U1-2 TaxID=2823141 RepID=UPI001AECC6E6|nr:biotin-dependent carboxyltransferase family protein [Aquimarina sp. U1-2]MBP2833633.1 biotin-dependent carboxyltransferase family protein [Aquimarina sp. U1-2]
MGKVKVVTPGLFSTIQDLGRFGYAKYGVPFGGAMDRTSFTLANALLGNHENDACIEWVYQPPILQFSEPTVVCLTGARTTGFLNEKEISMNRQLRVNKNDVLTINFCKNGQYGYVGIKGGFQSEVVLNSRSFFKEITSKESLQKGDEIMYTPVKTFTDSFSVLSTKLFIPNTETLQVYKGPEFDSLTPEQKEFLIHHSFTISGMANRMAIQLNEVLPNSLPSLLTSPVLPGTVQLTPSGRLIVLMRDSQTTGGYPRVLQLNISSIDVMAQKRTHEKVKFEIKDLLL